MRVEKGRETMQANPRYMIVNVETKQYTLQYINTTVGEFFQTLGEVQNYLTSIEGVFPANDNLLWPTVIDLVKQCVVEDAFEYTEE